MAEVIRMPRLSDTMTEGIIAGWHKKVGDKVKAGDVLADVETDKATMELESYHDGTLLYIGAEKGQAVKIDAVLGVIGKEGEDYKSLISESNGEAQTKTETKATENEKTEVKKEKATEPSTSGAVQLPEGAKEIRMPLLSDTMTEGKIVAWHKKVGDKVKSDDVLAEVETDKATMEVVGYEEGTLLYIGVEAGQAAKINQIIAIVGRPGTDVSAYVEAEKNKPVQGNKASSEKPEENSTGSTARADVSQQNEKAAGGNEEEPMEGGRIKASPLAKKMAADKGYDLSAIKGTGDGGRITRRDIESFTPSSAPTSQQETSAVKRAPSFAEGKEGFTDTDLTQMRKVIARRLGESKFSAPHFYLTMEINMDNAIKAREAMNEVSPVKISYNDMVIKACATALRLHPDVNSSWMGDFIRHNHHIHIGSAVALPEGLIVPVIKFADQKTLSQIAEEAKDLYSKARNKKLQPQEFSGNTFSISNLGMMDIDEFTAIINPPDSCILAVGRIKEVVVRTNEGFGVTNVMKVTMSCDHRTVDGAVGAAFLQTLKGFLENPVTMLV